MFICWTILWNNWWYLTWVIISIINTFPLRKRVSNWGCNKFIFRTFNRRRIKILRGFILHLWWRLYRWDICLWGWGLVHVMLIKISSFTDHDFLCNRIPEFPSLHSFRISNKDTFLHMPSQSFPFILLHMNISYTSPDLQMINFWFLIIPALIRS